MVIDQFGNTSGQLLGRPVIQRPRQRFLIGADYPESLIRRTSRPGHMGLCTSSKINLEQSTITGFIGQPIVARPGTIGR
jgi:hypothetical protein